MGRGDIPLEEQTTRTAHVPVQLRAGGGEGAWVPSVPTDPSLASDAFCVRTVYPGVTVAAQKPMGERALPLCVCVSAWALRWK